MSTGTPNPFPQKSPEPLKEIPFSWFSGTGYENRGIVLVYFSEEFFSMGNGEIATYANNYGHYMGTKKDPSEIEDIEIRALVEEAARKIKEITGFSINELYEQRRKLRELYKGKTEAPFEFELVE